MVHTNQAQRPSTPFNILRAKREAQHRREEGASHPEVIYDLSLTDQRALIEALPSFVERGALELLVSVGGCFSCGNTFKGSTSIISVLGPRELSCCPQCDQPSAVALNQLNALLTERLRAPVFLSAFTFSELLEEGARHYYNRSTEWLAHAAMGRRCVGATRLLRKRSWVKRGA